MRGNRDDGNESYAMDWASEQLLREPGRVSNQDFAILQFHTGWIMNFLKGAEPWSLGDGNPPVRRRG